THLHMGLGGEIVNFCRLGFLYDTDEVSGVGQVAVMHEKPRALLVRIDIEVIDSPGIERRGAPLNTVDRVTLLQQKLCEKCSVLTSYAGNQRDLGATVDPIALRHLLKLPRPRNPAEPLPSRSITGECGGCRRPYHQRLRGEGRGCVRYQARCAIFPRRGVRGAAKIIKPAPRVWPHESTWSCVAGRIHPILPEIRLKRRS